MSRLEYKYLFPKEKKEELLNDVKPYLVHDYYSEVRPDKEYTVRSIYLDTPVLTSYYEKLAGVKVRNKYRIRGYNELTEESKVFVEIKRKDSEYVSKDRAPVAYCDLDDFFEQTDVSKICNHTVEYESRLQAGKNFLYYLVRDRLRPVINVVYEREALECRFGSGLRMTFDMNIRSSLVQGYDELFNGKNLEILKALSFL